MEPQFDIGEAIKIMRRGGFVAREGWNGRGQFIGMQLPDKLGSNTLPYIYIITVDRQRVPWLASQTDLLADDWFEMPMSGTMGCAS